MYKRYFDLVKSLLSGLTIMVCFFSCGEKYKRNKSHQQISDNAIASGERLAQRYCSSCHVLPDPGLADAASWEKGILPNMGPRLGIFYFNFQPYPSSRNDRNVDSTIYPHEPVLSFDDWQKLLDYYTALSPDTMPLQVRSQPIKNDLQSFEIELPPFSYNDATISFIHVDTGKFYRLVVSDVVKKSTFFLDKNLQIIDSISNIGPIVDIDFSGENLLACDIGVLNPNNGKFGKAEVLKKGDDGKFAMEPVPMFGSLQRPVQITRVDLNVDGKMDYLVCEFGYVTGALSWMENKGNDSFVRHILRPLPGAIKAYIKDYNQDGLPDMFVLFAQGDESVILFTNKGNGEFAQQQVLRFPPSYGSSYFEMDDFNKDGFPDILYTCGDNADYSPILKPYHGVYIFINDGSYHFTQKYFYPIHGCYKAMARDFDGDGDLDIAAISFFADYTHQPEEGFVYFKNNGNLNFIPESMSGAQVGRWLTMEAGDVDGDGKIDIVLVSCQVNNVC